MKIASWNVNSIRARLDHVQRWLEQAKPDVLCLQETKVPDSEFPSETFSHLGYEVVRAGQKTYNGVAILSRTPLTDVRVGLTGEEEGADRRLIAATTQGVRVVCAYVPNGKTLDSPSYQEKLRWLEQLRETLEADWSPHRPLALCGDFNVAREASDVFDPDKMAGQIHFSEPEHQALQRVLEFGLSDSFRLKHHEPKRFSWWDYRMGSFRRDRGLRIDYVFVTAPIRDALIEADIDREPRGWERPSDHTPVWIDFSHPKTA
jgi:exodeoxyribonuclease-3